MCWYVGVCTNAKIKASKAIKSTMKISAPFEYIRIRSLCIMDSGLQSYALRQYISLTNIKRIRLPVRYQVVVGHDKNRSRLSGR